MDNRNLIAKEGYYITQKECKDEYRIFLKELYLSKNDSESRWVEWSEKEKEDFEQKMQELNEISEQ